MKYKRIIIETKANTTMEGENLLKEFKSYLKIHNLNRVKVLNIYELIHATEKQANEIANELLYESSVNNMYEDLPILKDREMAFRVVYHKGQYNQREDTTIQLINKFLNYSDIDVLQSKMIILEGINNDDLDKIKSYYINPIEAKEVPLDYFKYELEKETEEEIQKISGFIRMDVNELQKMKNKTGLGLDMEDLLHCQRYFKNENRDPNIAELKIIDTYWSDHCRHTTFMTEITDISIESGKYKNVLEETLREYLSSRDYVYGKTDRVISLMDLATINMKETTKNGALDNKEDSEEVNAASIEIDVDVDGRAEKWLLMFKNETHNHPTEMEPFGGAATCLGGGIRDPLSGRSFVYQAMRITGSGDPRQNFEDTLAGKLPQRKITQTAMEGYSSYGNQIGSASGYINEVYDEGFVAKRMELGALVAATPKDWVFRGKAEPKDLVILVGGRTGRDGLGGAVGSSKVQTEESLQTAGAEVQKGNPAIERKIVRLFRNPKATKMIKICNDFGAGGVAVAVGELADGLHIDLDLVPLKYPGLNGGEIAISESQERMAIVIDAKDLDTFMALVESEDLEGTVIAEVTDENRVHMVWRGKTIVDIKRDFLNTNGIRKKNSVSISEPDGEIYLTKNPKHVENKGMRQAFIDNMTMLNTASQKGLVERFDSTIGSGTVLLPLGGKYKLSPQEGMVAKIPVLHGETKTCSIMTCGYDPLLAKWSTFHGGYYAVIESIAKVVALGGDYKKVRLTFQEYFERLGTNPSKWGKPFSALLGAFLVQKNLNTPSIGGKDSMSGSFEEINVPPSLFSFAVVAECVENIISKEFKRAESQVVLVNLSINEEGLINFEQLEKNYARIKNLINEGNILASASIKFGGVARSISEMCFGNKIGFKFYDTVKDSLFTPQYGSILLELDKSKDIEKLFEGIDYSLVGTTIFEKHIEIDHKTIELKELIESWTAPLSDVFPIQDNQGDYAENLMEIHFSKGPKIEGSKKIEKPKVLIPVFTGTHGEYDMAHSFIKAGAQVDTFVFNTLSKDAMEESYQELARRIKECQILGLPNGSLFGDEPEAGGKLLKIILTNPWIKEAIQELLKKNDGLILGIGDGFKGLLKSGLIENAPTITTNISGTFVSSMTDIKVVSNLSPWMREMKIGTIYTNPLATKEGRIILADEGKHLLKNGQIASQFAWENITGSAMGIESLTSLDGRVLGTISSIDRMGNDIYKNGDIKGTHHIFEAGVNYFK